MAHRLVMVMVAVVLILTAVPSLAAGPLDGIYQLTETFPGGGQSSYHVSVTQNGLVLAALMFGVVGQDDEWAYALSTIGPDSIAVGTLYTYQGAPYGTVAARFFADGTLVAEARVGAVTSTITGFKVF